MVESPWSDEGADVIMVRTIRTLCCVAAVLAACQFRVAAGDEAKKEANASIVVRIVDDKGEAWPNATVSLFHYDQDASCWKNLNREKRPDQAGTVIYDAVNPDESYDVFAKTKDGRIGFRSVFLDEKATKSEATLKLERPLVTTVRVHESAKRPIAGVEMWGLNLTGANGPVHLSPKSLQSCGFSAPISNAKGELTLSPLPPGTMDLRIIHPDFAPIELKALYSGATADATLKPGATVELHIRMEPNAKLADLLKLDLRCASDDKASTLIGPLRWLQPDGTVKLTVAPGEYSWLRLIHPDFIGTPLYRTRWGKTIADEREQFRIEAGVNRFDFELKRKVKVRGRVVRQGNSEPVREAMVRGDAYAGKVSGKFGRFADEWTFADWGETNAKGEYEIGLATGLGRVTFSSQGLVANPAFYEVSAAGDGSTIAPDFIVSPTPTIRGVVQNVKGQPVPNAVVRFRGSILTSESPVTTDAQGRFELKPRWIPKDLQTEEPLESQTIVAFHPFEPLGGSLQFRWDQPELLEHVVLTLRPQAVETSISGITEDLTPEERGIVRPDAKNSEATTSLTGKPAPELDGSVWLNTDKKRLSLADLRGKYVLLQFYATWCGPCHADMPCVRLVDRLYHDSGVVVIGVHDNSMPIDDVKKDAAENELTYPIVADQADGRIYANYKVHSYPTYILIGPDGNIVRDDRTITGPSLRGFTIETIRQLLMTQTGDKTHGPMK
jgi:thiol-disulfide isomerase/thioredoxin